MLVASVAILLHSPPLSCLYMDGSQHKVSSTDLLKASTKNIYTFLCFTRQCKREQLFAYLHCFVVFAFKILQKRERN